MTDAAQSFENKLARIFEATGARGDTSLARILGIKPPSVAAARKRQQIPGAWVEKIAKLYGINANWLLFGTGPKSFGEQSQAMPAGHGMPGAVMGHSAAVHGHPAHAHAHQERLRVMPVMKPTPWDVPVMGLSSGGIPGWYYTGPMAFHLPMPVEYPVNPEVFAVIATGLSMQPEGIRHGYVLICDPSITPEPGDAIYIEKVDGIASIKLLLSKEESSLLVQDWTEPDRTGKQQISKETISLDTVRRLAPVVIVKRKA